MAEGRTQGMVLEVELVTENQRNQHSPAGQDGELAASSGIQTGLSRKGLAVGGDPPPRTQRRTECQGSHEDTEKTWPQ